MSTASWRLPCESAKDFPNARAVCDAFIETIKIKNKQIGSLQIPCPDKRGIGIRKALLLLEKAKRKC